MDFLLDPNVAYFLLVSGFVLAILALFAPGTGFLEIGALLMLLMAGYGIINMPVNAWALALLVLGVFPFLFALRRTKGAPGSRRYLFLGGALAAMVVGSVFLFRGENQLLAVNPFLASFISILAFALLWLVALKGLEAIALPASHSLERFIGQVGEARTDIFREGAVYVGGEEWTARSNQFIPAGSRVRVTGRDGLVLTVETVSAPAA